MSVSARNSVTCRTGKKYGIENIGTNLFRTDFNIIYGVAINMPFILNFSVPYQEY
jgi:hypothetical protein